MTNLPISIKWSVQGVHECDLFKIKIGKYQFVFYGIDDTRMIWTNKNIYFALRTPLSDKHGRTRPDTYTLRITQTHIV